MNKLHERLNLLSSAQSDHFFSYLHWRLPLDGHRTRSFSKLLAYLQNTPQKEQSLDSCAEASFNSGNKVAKLRRWLTIISKTWDRFVALELSDPEPHWISLGKSKWLLHNADNELAQRVLLEEGHPTPINDLSLAYSNLVLYGHQYEFLSQNQRRENVRIKEVLDQIQLLDLGLKVKWACLAKSHSIVSGKTYDLQFMLPVERLLCSTTIEVPKIIQLYFSAYQILQDQLSKEEINTFIACLVDVDELPPLDQKHLLIFAINHCIKMANSGERAYIEKAFSLYKIGLENGVLLLDGHLSTYTFANIVNHGIALEQWSWTETFMEKYHPSITEARRQSTYQFNRSRLLFYKGDYDLVKEILSVVEFNDLNYNVEARRMMTKIYLVEREYQALDYYLDSFKIYLLRHKSQLRYYREYSALVKAARRCLKLSSMTNVEKQSLISSIEKQKTFADQRWLLQFLKSA